MNSIKKVWVSNISERSEIYSITFESSTPDVDFLRVRAREMSFPAEPTPEKPLRHTVNIATFSREDLIEIYNTIGQALRDN
jgi:hypothetical protein